jgi:putative transcriptional regulator
MRFEHNEMTQQDLADRVGVTRQTIIALESGKYAPSLLLAFKLARAFGVELEGLFHYNGDVDGD